MAKKKSPASKVNKAKDQARYIKIFKGNMTLNDLEDSFRMQGLQLSFTFAPIKNEFKTKLEGAPIEPTDPRAGQESYFVICSRLSIYTTIGADNRHHAANKATKLFGPHWSSLTRSQHLVQYYEHHHVASFSELLRTLQN